VNNGIPGGAPCDPSKQRKQDILRKAWLIIVAVVIWGLYAWISEDDSSDPAKDLASRSPASVQEPPKGFANRNNVYVGARRTEPSMDWQSPASYPEYSREAGGLPRGTFRPYSGDRPDSFQLEDYRFRPLTRGDKRRSGGSPPAISGQQYDRISPPAYSGQQYDRMSPPAYSGQQYDRISPPAYSEQQYDRMSPPAYSGQQYDRMSPPARSGQQYDRMSPPARSGQQYDRVSPPAYSEPQYDRIFPAYGSEPEFPRYGVRDQVSAGPGPEMRFRPLDKSGSTPRRWTGNYPPVHQGRVPESYGRWAVPQDYGGSMPRPWSPPPRNDMLLYNPLGAHDVYSAR
jgi:hypothetical protein